MVALTSFSFVNLAVKSSEKIFTLNPKYPKAYRAFVECTRIDINLGQVICSLVVLGAMIH